MEEKSLGRSFLILSIAGILVKILSAAYVPVLTAVIGKTGYGVYAASYNAFIFILAITSMGAQPAITKVVAEYRAVGNSKDALVAMKIARKYLAIVGLILTVVFMVFSKGIARGMNSEASALSLVFLAPTILFSAILAAYRGYMQGVEDMQNLAVSQVVEQVINVVLSLIFAIILRNISLEWGSAGGTVGTSIGALVAILFLIYIFNKKRYEEEAIKSTTVIKKENKKKIVKKLLAYGLPITLVATMQNSGGLIDTFNVNGRLLAAGFDENIVYSLFGTLTFYNTLLYVPLTIVTALSSAVFPKIIQAFVAKNKKELKSQISYTYKLTYLITIPAALGLSLLSRQIYIMIFNTAEGSELLMYGSVVLILMSITTIQNTILQGINKLYLVLTTAFIGIVIKFVINYALVGIKEINILGAIIASFFAFLVPAIINHRKLRNVFKVNMPIIKMAIIPFISSCAMALGIIICRMPLNRLMEIFNGGRLATSIMVLILIPIGGLIYGVMIILLGGVTRKDLDGISPKIFTMLPRFLRKNM